MQQPFGCAFPRGIFGAHLNQFPGKRHGVFRHFELRAKHAPDGDLRLGNIAASFPEGDKFCRYRLVFLFEAAQIDARFGLLVL